MVAGKICPTEKFHPGKVCFPQCHLQEKTTTTTTSSSLQMPISEKESSVPLNNEDLLEVRGLPFFASFDILILHRYLLALYLVALDRVSIEN